MRKCVFNSLLEHRVLCSNIKLFVQTKIYMFKQIHMYLLMTQFNREGDTGKMLKEN